MVVKRWLDSMHSDADIVCLQEVKSCDNTLLQRLKTIDPRRFWVTTNHPSGSGGSALGIADIKKKEIVQILEEECHAHWVGVKLGGPHPLNVVSLYAAGNVQGTQLTEPPQLAFTAKAGRAMHHHRGP